MFIILCGVSVDLLLNELVAATNSMIMKIINIATNNNSSSNNKHNNNNKK